MFMHRAAAAGSHSHSGSPAAAGSKNGTLGSFASSVWSPSAGSIGRREESYHLLLELCSQEPTVQCCFKIIESTCLARGVDLEIGGKQPTSEFRTFVTRCVVGCVVSWLGARWWVHFAHRALFKASGVHVILSVGQLYMFF